MRKQTVRQIVDIIDKAVERRFPLDVSVWNGTWILMKSRFVGVENEHVFIELPRGETGNPPDVTPAMKIGLAFKVRNHKYMCPVRVVGTVNRAGGEGETASCLELCYPTRMDSLQKRNYSRVEVPEERSVRVTFWPGGIDGGPPKPDTEAVYTARVRDISAGGLRAFFPGTERPVVEEGSPAGTRIAFGTGTDREVVSADAQVRYCSAVAGGFVLGMKFLGLEQTPKGKGRLGVILRKMKAF